MNLVKTTIAAIAVGSTFGLATQASAVVNLTGFATYSPFNNNNNVQYVSSGNAAGNKPTRTENGKFETIVSTLNSRGKVISTAPGAVKVNFSFLDPVFATSIYNIPATYLLNATISKNTSPTSTTGAFDYTTLNGTFEFRSLAPINLDPAFFVPTPTIAAGALLLSGKIVNGKITGTFPTVTPLNNGTSGGSASSGAQTTFQFASAFLDFTNVANVDFSQTLTSVTPAFGLIAGTTPAKAAYGLKSFKALAGGTFSSDPPPVINGLLVVPEPEIWGLMVVGFGLVGLQVRRRKSSTVTAH